MAGVVRRTQTSTGRRRSSGPAGARPETAGGRELCESRTALRELVRNSQDVGSPRAVESLATWSSCPSPRARIWCSTPIPTTCRKRRGGGFHGVASGLSYCATRFERMGGRWGAGDGECAVVSRGVLRHWAVHRPRVTAPPWGRRRAPANHCSLRVGGSAEGAPEVGTAPFVAASLRHRVVRLAGAVARHSDRTTSNGREECSNRS
jgi:hypothetical protein